MKCPNYKNGCTTHGEVNPAKLLGGIKTPKASDASRRNGRKSKGRPKGSKNKPKKVSGNGDSAPRGVLRDSKTNKEITWEEIISTDEVTRI